MLVLSRKTHERIVMRRGDIEISVKVVEVRGNGTVRLGFEAPSDVKIHREEVWEAIAREKQL